MSKFKTGNVVKHHGSIIIITEVHDDVTHWISFDSENCSGITRNKSYIEIINERYDDLFETHLAFIHEAFTTHSKIKQDFVLLGKAYEEMHKIVIPDRITKYMFGYQNTRLLLFSFRIAVALGYIDEAKMYAAKMYNDFGQRLGIYLEWTIEKKDTEYFVMKYIKADPERMQFIDVVRPWWR